MHLSLGRSAFTTLLSMVLVTACGDDEPQRPDAGGNLCTPNAAECAARGLNCGRVDLPDGTCITCGTCQLGTETCGGGGQANVCGCTPRSCQELGFDCGAQDNMCGGTVECGVCLGGAACLGGMCQALLGPEADCARTPNACEAGLLCCAVGDGQACLPEDPSGGCPAPLADLVLDRPATVSSISFETLTFQPTSCAISDGCIPGPGTYKLLRFATQINNIGLAPLRAGTPAIDPGFTYDQCHMHYHFAGFVQYALRARQSDGTPGETVAGGFKFSYCIEDVLQTHPEREDSPMSQVFQCGDGTRPQGLSVGWGDLYEAALDCQWVDITNVAPGNYFLELTANPERKMVESRYSNNVLTVPVTIP